MTTTSTPPKGYRWLRKGAFVRDGDGWCDEGKVVNIRNSEVGLMSYGPFPSGRFGYVRPLPKCKAKAAR